MQQKEETIFCIDTSALVDLHKYYGQDRMPELWAELDELLHIDKIISHKIVFDELTTNAKRPSSLSRWVTSKRSNFKDMTGIQAQHVASIIIQFPGLIDPKHEKDQADPWLIALVLEQRSQSSLFMPNQEIIMVSQEDKLSTRKIPAVCKHYDIRHLDLFEFFDYNNWAITFQKR